MSATTEILLEEIQKLKELLSSTTDQQARHDLTQRLSSLEEKLTIANQRLNEGKGVLKG